MELQSWWRLRRTPSQGDPAQQPVGETTPETRLVGLLDEIEDEAAQLWPELECPSDEDVATGGAFGAATMTLPQWIKHVFRPEAAQAVADGDLPGHREIASHAVYALTQPAAQTLLELLADFDAEVVRLERDRFIEAEVTRRTG